MTIDTLTIILSSIVLLLAIGSPLLSPLFRLRKPESSPSAEDVVLPPVTVLITVHRNPKALEQNLSAFLGQQYEPGFEVIVVAEKGDSEVEDVLKRHSKHPNLYTTYIPESSRYMSRKKLAITLGVKAAHNEWIVLAECYCRPLSDQWLKALACHFDATHNLVIGYSGLEADTNQRYRFRRLTTSAYALRKAQRGTAYRCSTAIMAFRKSEFMKGEGFRGSLKHIGGEFDYLVNKYARPYSTAVATSPEALVEEKTPTRHEWINSRLFYLHTGHNLSRGLSLRLLNFVDSLFLHLALVTSVSGVAYGALTTNWILTGASAAALIIGYVERIIVAHAKIAAYAPGIPLWLVPFFETQQVWGTIGLRIRFLFTDKYAFTCHKQ